MSEPTVNDPMIDPVQSVLRLPKEADAFRVKHTRLRPRDSVPIWTGRFQVECGRYGKGAWVR
jgi:hypothetical protein